ncbi:MAG: efflux RND transporter periplasmic adaptor subunit [Cyanothece sp. SIO2G6]|nr:efflux RND transporter periplasmic adaptor subunit [Cyanothece sp. SIO2G6]
MAQQIRWVVGLCLILPGILLSSACSREQGTPVNSPRPEQTSPPPLVDIAIAQGATTAAALTYSGTTAPVQTVAVRARTEGQLLDIAVDVGDRVRQGDFLAQLDTDFIDIEINETQAELAARQFEVEQAKAELAEAQTEVERAKAEWQQAQVDAERFQSLAADQVIPLQTAELAQTSLQTAAQILRAAEQQVTNRERAIDSVEYRVAVQQAIVEQAKERSGYARLESPLTGTVLTRLVDLGDLIQPGQILLEMGDLSAVHINIQVSDRAFNQFAVGQAVDVQLDAFPGQSFSGRVTQISPVADAAARLIPVEVTMPNPGRQISSGLMARVTVATPDPETVFIPAGAIALSNPATDPATDLDSDFRVDSPVVFVPTQSGEDGEDITVTARPVEIGQQDNGQIEILSGLQPGETFVVNSNAALTDGQTVRRSVLSEE